MSMTKEHRNLIGRKHREEFLKHLKLSEEFFTIIEKSKKIKVSEFLNILKKCPDTAFNKFVEALVLTNQDELAKLLDLEYASTLIYKRSKTIIFIYPIEDYYERVIEYCY